jgi:hypothetical protein
VLVHLIRYHDVLAPHAADRAQIVPGPEVTEGAAATGTPVPSGGRIQRLAWAALLTRVFAVEVTLSQAAAGACSGPSAISLREIAPSANSAGHSLPLRIPQDIRCLCESDRIRRFRRYRP